MRNFEILGGGPFSRGKFLKIQLENQQFKSAL